MSYYEQDNWNMNKGFYQHCVDIILIMDGFAARQDAYNWYSFMRMLYRKIWRRLDKETNESLEQGFDEVRDILNVTTNIKTERNKQFYGNIQRGKALNRLDKLEMELIGAMTDKNIIPKTVKGLDSGEAIRGQFGL